MANSPVAFSAAAAARSAADAPPSGRVVASLQVHDPPKKGSPAKLGPEREPIEFQFNPKELSLTKAAKWEAGKQRNPAKAAPPEFKHSEPCKLQLEMFFDATDEMDSSVVKRVEALFGCVVKTGKHKTPPWVVFQWGGLTAFPAYVSSVSAKYTLFTPGGLPVRAVCTVTLEEISGELTKQNPTSGALASRDVHLVVSGDTLAGIAFQQYGDPALWREIAVANGIDDPMRLRPGSRLLVPAMEELEVRDGQ